jgi:FkbM family methyltransferase
MWMLIKKAIADGQPIAKKSEALATINRWRCVLLPFQDYRYLLNGFEAIRFMLTEWSFCWYSQWFSVFFVESLSRTEPWLTMFYLQITSFSCPSISRRSWQFNSWAQEEEDIILDYALYGVEDGTYVDVGANDLSVISVTKAFYGKNWPGINIEPPYDRYILLMKPRPRDVNVNIACSVNHSVLRLWPAGAFTTMDPTIPLTRRRRSIPVQVYQLSEAMANYSTSMCHFCKIDVEGFQKEVLWGMNWITFRPWTFCIEATPPVTTIPCHQKCQYILLEHG